MGFNAVPNGNVSNILKYSGNATNLTKKINQLDGQQVQNLTGLSIMVAGHETK